MKWDDLLPVLIELLKRYPGIKGARIVSTEGLPITSIFLEDMEETEIAAMTAALLALAEQSIFEMKKGKFDQLYIKGSDGYLLILQIASKAVLTVSTTKDVRIGLIFLECKRICEKIEKLF